MARKMQSEGLRMMLCLSAVLANVQMSVGLFDGNEMPTDEANSRLVEPLYHFTYKLFSQVNREKENIVISPMSIHSALSMVLLGAKSGSVTEKELIETLGYSKLSGTLVEAYQSYANLSAQFKQLNEAASIAKKKPKPRGRRRSIHDKYTELEVWNMAILKSRIDPLPSYLEDVKTYHSSDVKRIVDDKPEEKRQIVDSINQWAKSAGFEKGIIRKDDLDGQFSVLLLSAIQVQGYWFNEFSEYEDDEAFYNHGSSKNPTKAMCLRLRDLEGAKYLEFTKKQPSNTRQADLDSSVQRAIEELAGPTFRALKIPLKDELSFTIFEPLFNGSGNELAKLEDHLLEVDSGTGLLKLHRALQLLDEKIVDPIEYIQFPRFKFESDIDLEKPLNSMGLREVFSTRAELSRLAQDKLYVSKAKHQAVFEVNKLGLRGAGMTIIKAVPLMFRIPRDPIRLVIRNPFMFVVRYNKVPLFIGHLVEV